MFLTLTRVSGLQQQAVKMNIENIKEYLDKGIHHYEEEINKLDVKSERSTKYMYNKGAVDALNNMLLFINNTKIEETNETIITHQKSIYDVDNPITYKQFTGAIPTKFEYNKNVYETLVKNKNNPIYCPQIIDGTFVYKDVGSCEVGIVNNVMYLKGSINESFPCVGLEQISLAVYKDGVTPVFILGEGQSNYQQVRGNVKKRF